jgi:hypothetical protein
MTKYLDPQYAIAFMCSVAVLMIFFSAPKKVGHVAQRQTIAQCGAERLYAPCFRSAP